MTNYALDGQPCLVSGFCIDSLGGFHTQFNSGDGSISLFSDGGGGFAAFSPSSCMPTTGNVTIPIQGGLLPSPGGDLSLSWDICNCP
jgi:hypothetical protein